MKADSVYAVGTLICNPHYLTYATQANILQYLKVDDIYSQL